MFIIFIFSIIFLISGIIEQSTHDKRLKKFLFVFMLMEQEENQPLPV